MEGFKGVGWLKWENQFITLARLAYSHAGLECLADAAKAKGEIDGGVFMQLEPAVEVSVQQAISVDIVATLGFLLEGEPQDMLNNCSTNGLELWRRSEAPSLCSYAAICLYGYVAMWPLTMSNRLIN